MLEDLEFLVGERDDLKGRAILFTENAAGTENPFNPRYPAIAVASDPSELMSILSAITPLPENLRDPLLERIKQSAEMWSRTMFGPAMFRSAREMLSQGLENYGIPKELEERLRAEIERIPEEPAGVSFHCCFLPLIGFNPSVVEPYAASCDVLRAGTVPSITHAGLVLSGHAQHYLATFFSQREESAPRTEEEPGASKAPLARDLPPADFLGLLSRKVSELMFARETGEPLETHIRELVDIARGSVFIRDVLNLASMAETTHPRRIEIIDLYLRRISLLAEERYEEIPPIDRRIQELRAQETPPPPPE